MTFTEAEQARFWAKVNKTDGCWLWTAAKLPGGYGQVGCAKRHWRAHRLSWEMNCGPIPPAINVCHSCDVPACVRPSHLFLGTTAENVADKVAKKRAGTGRPAGSRWVEKLTDEVIDQVVALRKQGLQYREIAPLVGISKSSVGNAIAMETQIGIRATRQHRFHVHQRAQDDGRASADDRHRND